MRGAVLAGAVALGSLVHAADERATVEAMGGIAWISDDALEGEGLMRVEVTAPLPRRWLVSGAFAARTAIRGADGLTFSVRDVGYDGELALGRTLASGLGLFGVGGVWGKEAVDAQGSAQAGLLGLGVGAEGSTLAVRAELGGIVDAREIDADAWGRLRARWRPSRVGVDLDLRVLEGEDTESDLTVGPFLEIPADDLLVRAFAAYLRHTTPLGLGLTGAQVGLRFEDREPARLEGGGARLDGDVSGRIGAGFGDGQRAGRLQLVAESPRWRERWRLAADVDGQTLSGADPGDLFYRYTVGLERFLHGRRHLLGTYFYHRSGHRLGEPGDTVTSFDVVEVGHETDDFRRGAGTASSWVGLDWRVRVGYLLDSSFGEDVRWHARAAARFTAPVSWTAVPYVESELEEGDVRARQAAAGLAFASGLELAVSWSEDDQLFGPDSSALLGTATLRF